MLDVNFARVAGQISLAWSPNFISTQEAFTEYMDRLKEDGFLCYTLFSYTRSHLSGEKRRRLVSLVAGMKMAGITQPEDQIAILFRPLPYGYQTMFMAKKTPYTKEELIDIRRIAAFRNAKVEVFYPDMEKIIGSEGIRPPEEGMVQQTKTYLQGVKDICGDTKPIHGLMANLWLPGLRKLKTLVDSGYFGRVLFIRGEHGYWVFEGDGRPGQRPSWNYRREDGGGIVLDMMCHWHYMLEGLFGPVRRVTCAARTSVPERWDEAGKRYDAPADDTAAVICEMASGALAQITLSWFTRVRRDDLMGHAGPVPIPTP